MTVTDDMPGLPNSWA